MDICKLLFILLTAISAEELIFPHTTKEVSFGDTVYLTCDVEGNHTWLFNGNTILDSGINPSDAGLDNIFEVSSTDTFSFLLIRQLRPMNIGNYSCIVDDVEVSRTSIKPLDTKLSIQINGLQSDNLAIVTAGRENNLSCSSNILASRVNITMKVNATSLTDIGQERKLVTKLTVIPESRALITWSRSTLYVAISCQTNNSPGTETNVETRLLTVVALPDLRVQIDDENITKIYNGKVGQAVVVKCVAFGARPAVALMLVQTAIKQESILDIKETPNKYEESTMDYEIQRATVLKMDTFVTCKSYDQTYLHNATVKIMIQVGESNITNWMEIVLDTRTIILFSCVAVTFVIGVVGCCVNRNICKEKQRKFSRKYSQHRLSHLVKNQPLTIISLLHRGEIYSYWTCNASGSPDHKLTVAKSFTESKKETFVSIADMSKCLQRLSHHRNIVTYLGKSLRNEKSFLYFKYVENGTLREYLKNQSEQGLMSIPPKKADELEKSIKLIQQIAEALDFLHINNFCHPVLSSSKVLMAGSLTCKLFDIWPVECSSCKIRNLLTRENPPFQWLPPESKHSSQYYLASDVWSFGILIWEICSFGKEPSEVQRYARKLPDEKSQENLGQPQFCPTGLFELMTKMWQNVPGKRPLVSTVREMVLTQKWEEYDYLSTRASYEAYEQVL